MIDAVLGIIGRNPEWTAVLIFLVSGAESLVIVGVLVPGTAVMMGLGALIPSGTIDLWTALVAGSLGAAAGDAVSFWLGGRFRHVIPRLGPLRRHPQVLARAQDFVQRHGGKSVFIGRFVGPLRAAVPTMAGMLGMPVGRFTLANLTSAVLWVLVVLSPGAALAGAVENWDALGTGGQVAVIAAALLLVAAAIALWRSGWLRRVLG